MTHPCAMRLIRILSELAFINAKFFRPFFKLTPASKLVTFCELSPMFCCYYRSFKIFFFLSIIFVIIT